MFSLRGELDGNLYAARKVPEMHAGEGSFDFAQDRSAPHEILYD